MNTSASLLFTIGVAFYFEMRRRMSTMGDEGMTNGPSTLAYLAFRSRRDAVEGISKPTKMTAWRGPMT
jgi:hypothetical protein